MKKKLAATLSVVLILGLAVLGILAYLSDTDSDVNVMTLGDVKIEQIEQERVDDTAKEHELKDFSSKKDSDVKKPLFPAVYDGSSIPWAPENEWVKAGDQAWKVVEDNDNVVDKFVTVKNTGTSPAYVRTLIAYEGNQEYGPEGKWIHVIHNGTNVNPAIDISAPIYINVDGTEYTLYVYTYPAALDGGATSIPSLKQVYMDKEATNEVVEKYGESYDILVCSQAVQTAGFDNAKTALDTAFYEVDKDHHPWTTIIPEDAVAINDETDLKEAVKNGGEYYIEKPMTVDENLAVAEDTAIYNKDSNNTLSFENNAKITVNADKSLELYGVQMDCDGEYSFAEDGSIVYDADARRTTPLLNVSAGSELVVGEGTVIENVVAKGSAVINTNGTDANRAKVTIEGATIKNCAGESGTIINVNKASDVTIGEGTVISGNASYNNNNHGIIRVYNAWDAANPSTVTMDGGEITGNYYSGNGMIGLYYGKFIMNGGSVSGNKWFEDNQVNNGWYPIVYAHSNSQFIMNGGTMSNNVVKYGVINSLNSSVKGALTINGGTITNNIATNNEGKDALAAVISKTGNSLSISDKANATGTVWVYYDENGNYSAKYMTQDEYFGN